MLATLSVRNLRKFLPSLPVILAVLLCGAVAWFPAGLTRSGLLFAADQPAPPPPTVDITDTLEKVGSPVYREREAATKKIQELLEGGKLTADQIKAIREAAAGPDAEVRARLGPILLKYFATRPAVKAIIEAAKAETLPAKPNRPYQVILGGAKGNIDSVTSHNHWTKIQNLWNEANDALRRGDTAKAKEKLEELKKYIKDMDKDEYDDIRFRKDKNVTQQQMVDQIQGAIDKIPDAKNQIEGAAGGPKPPMEKPKTPMQNPGPASTGMSFRLDVTDVAAPGEIDFALALDAGDVGSAAPNCYEYVGHAVEVWSDGQVRLDGPVTIGLQYDAASDVEYGPLVADPAQLELVRIVGGQYQTLAPVAHDLGTSTLYGTYDALPGEIEPFGTFGLIQPAPCQPEESDDDISEPEEEPAPPVPEAGEEDGAPEPEAPPSTPSPGDSTRLTFPPPGD